VAEISPLRVAPALVDLLGIARIKGPLVRLTGLAASLPFRASAFGVV
jgi:hypothetical protein